MNITTILVSQEEALSKLDAYRAVKGRRRVAEDDRLQQVYAAISRGARVLHLPSAFREAGLDAQQRPRLAIARADWPIVHCYRPWQLQSVGFSQHDRWNTRATATNISLPRNTFAWDGEPRWGHLRSQVPHIPPAVRPKLLARNYHILFEVQAWEEYPVDPFLLRHITGQLYIVEAEWELTHLEATLLGAMGE